MLQVHNLTFGFNSKNIFQNLNLSIHEKEITGIMGKNGVGKTTLFRLIAGIYKPGEGQLKYGEHVLRPHEVAFLPAEPFFYHYITGREYLQLVHKKEYDSTLHLARILDLPVDQLVDTYSTGMKKKLAFVAIINQLVPIIILDEPFNGVDLESNELLKAVIRQHKQDRMILVSSHILQTLTDICDRIYYLRENHEILAFEKIHFDDLNQLIELEIAQKLITKESEEEYL